MQDRRHFLKSIASTLALPLLEPAHAAMSRAGVVKPTRLAYVYIPNGVNVEQWFPTGTGRDFSFSPSLKPLEALREDIQVITGLMLDKAKPNGDGAGDHARANSAFLTGCQPYKTAGADIRIGVSVDQIAARHLSGLTRLSSLELSTDEQRRSGNCDSGYSCAYQFNLSWRSDTTPAPPERDPRLVFESLFGAKDDSANQSRRARRKSVLDFVLAESKALQARASYSDRNKLDEYYTSVREIEQRIQRAESFAVAEPTIAEPGGIPQSYREHIRLMFDLMRVAFQSDSTRVASYLLAHDGSNRTFPEININESHHNLSHHQLDPRRLALIAEIDRFYATELALFLENMKKTPDGDGSLLDHSMILYGAGIQDGDRHNHGNLPIILAGRGSGQLQPGKLLAATEGTPLTNLHLSLLERLGVPAQRVGDSTGSLQGI